MAYSPVEGVAGFVAEDEFAERHEPAEYYFPAVAFLLALQFANQNFHFPDVALDPAKPGALEAVDVVVVVEFEQTVAEAVDLPPWMGIVMVYQIAAEDVAEIGGYCWGAFEAAVVVPLQLTFPPVGVLAETD